MAKEEIIALVKKYVILLNTEGLSVQKAFLFGSYSTGLATDSSDIDVMLVSDKFDETDDIAIGKMWRLTRKINTKIEPFLVGINKFRKDETSLLISIVKDSGIEII